MQETRVQSLGWEDPLEKGMTTHSSILAWKIPWSEMVRGARQATVYGVAETQINICTFTGFLVSFSCQSHVLTSITL